MLLYYLFNNCEQDCHPSLSLRVRPGSASLVTEELSEIGTSQMCSHILQLFLLPQQQQQQQPGHRCGKSNPSYLNGISHYRRGGEDNRPLPFLYQHISLPEPITCQTPPPSPPPPPSPLPPTSIHPVTLHLPSGSTSAHCTLSLPRLT